MTKEEQIFFDRLSEIRAKGADLLEEPFMSGVKTGTIEKYSDQAHFIYELLQNADDVKATECRFELFENSLAYTHNGKDLFTISNPDTEKEDKAAGKLGDINAITSIGNSSKTQSVKIGKFGVGFKAVFQYTTTPRIYDPNIKFKIDRFIVPEILTDDYEGRGVEETTFVFPFDHSRTSAEIAVDDIFDKIQKLVFPILFLKNLKTITYKYKEHSGSYEKVLVEKRNVAGTEAELLQFNQVVDSEKKTDYIWLFTRKNDEGYSYSTGFFIDEDDKLIGRDFPAFCFFPTKEKTGVKFIVHAPFLLTDSREGIRAANMHNVNLVAGLAKLAADALVILRDIGIEKSKMIIDDGIFDIIPYEDTFADLYSKSEISFKPFFTEIKNMFLNEQIIPAGDEYAYSDEAYWALYPPVSTLLTNEQMADLFDEDSAKWVFKSFGRYETNRTNRPLSQYIESIIADYIEDDEIFNRLTKSFVEKQPLEWFFTIYEYIGERTNRIESMRTKLIFIDKDGHAATAFDSKGVAILFLPSGITSEFNTLHPDLLADERTIKLAKAMGIQQPSLKGEIYNIILPLYESEDDIDTEEHFLKFFQYYKECPSAEKDGFIKLIKNCEFVEYETNEGECFRGKAGIVYFPTDELKAIFRYKKDVAFLRWDNYLEIVGEEDEELLRRFFEELGVAYAPRVCRYDYSYSEVSSLKKQWARSTWYREWYDYRIDGCLEILEAINGIDDIDKSLMLWKLLLSSIAVMKSQRKSVYNLINGTYRYFFRQERFEAFTSICVSKLRNEKWLINAKNEMVSPDETSLQEIDARYPLFDTNIDDLCDLLDIERLVSSEVNENLSDEERAKILFAEKFMAAGIDEAYLDEFREFIQMKKSQEALGTKVDEEGATKPSGQDSIDLDKPVEKKVKKVIKDIVKKVATTPPASEVIDDESEDKDEDEFTHPSVDYQKKIEKAQEKSALEIAKITQLEELQSRIEAQEVYSYGWFKAILDLEMQDSNDNNMRSREVSISFAKIEKEPNTNRVYILKQPNRYIPNFMEDLSDIPMVLLYGDQTIRVAIEVASIKGYTLRVKLKKNAEIGEIDLTRVKAVTIEAKNPGFILEELNKRFIELGYSDDYDMQDNLCENIEFIFGPPGTGKTTYLANKVIMPLMAQKEDVKVLVLTPTNKAADVLTSRIMEIMGDDQSYLDWLIRFGLTNDETIEKAGVFRDRTTDIRHFHRNVVVTTIARFPYDYFMPDTDRLYLNGLNWDYIIIDEASMIPLVNIIYPLYRKTPKKFIIAGDPFQIEPITAVEYWKDENIYTMVELDSFEKPTTVPHDYNVTLLTKQYRSVPALGEMFSRFSYDGILEHHRSAESAKELGIDDFMHVEPVNIVKFPVQKYESIFRSKKLQGSSNYHIYAALFTFEFIKHISGLLHRQGKAISIGVIAPYRAQADLIQKLNESWKGYDEISVQVGTIHGFQGDECDIIITVFNPPPYISDSPDMFLNKRNIINVSISRARDYLFIIMPDDNTERVENLKLVKKVEKIAKSMQYTEMLSNELEERIFNNSNYIEENSFSTSHQIVNVYGLPEMRYEIRSEDTAVDIQIHDTKG